MRCYARFVRLVLALVLASSACAGATRTSRDAWDKAITRRDEPGDGSAGSGGERGSKRGSRGSDGWQAIAHFVLDASERLAGGSTTVALTRLAEQLCVEVPAELEEDPALAAVRCPPRSPLGALSHELELELGSASTIALFARDLTDPASAELVRQFQQRLKNVCRGPWRPVSRGADNALEEFHTCSTRTGAVLVLGRFPTDLGAGQWQFSLAVLGPG